MKHEIILDELFTSIFRFYFLFGVSSSDLHAWYKIFWTVWCTHWHTIILANSMHAHIHIEWASSVYEIKKSMNLHRNNEVHAAAIIRLWKMPMNMNGEWLCEKCIRAWEHRTGTGVSMYLFYCIAKIIIAKDSLWMLKNCDDRMNEKYSIMQHTTHKNKLY